MKFLSSNIKMDKFGIFVKFIFYCQQYKDIKKYKMEKVEKVGKLRHNFKVKIEGNSTN